MIRFKEISLSLQDIAERMVDFELPSTGELLLRVRLYVFCFELILYGKRKIEYFVRHAYYLYHFDCLEFAEDYCP